MGMGMAALHIRMLLAWPRFHFPIPRFPAPFPCPIFPSSPHRSWHLQFFPPPPGSQEGSGLPHQHGDPTGTPGELGEKPRPGQLPRDPHNVGPIPLPGEAVPDPAAAARSRLSRGAGPFLRQEPPEEPFPPAPSFPPTPWGGTGRDPSAHEPGHPAPAPSPAPSVGAAGNRGEPGPAQCRHERDLLPRTPAPLEVGFGGPVALGLWDLGFRGFTGWRMGVRVRQRPPGRFGAGLGGLWNGCVGLGLSKEPPT